LAERAPSFDNRAVSRWASSFVFLFACGGHVAFSAAIPAQPQPPPPSPTPSAMAAAVATVDPPPPPAPPPPPPYPHLVFHAGDSMVGGPGGISGALERKFKPLGTKMVRDWRVATVQTFDYANHFGKLLDQHHPDMVIVSLGANDVFVPNPSSLARFVRSIARKASDGGRPCYWITPPLWKPPDTGIVAVIKANASPCLVFDSSELVLPKWPDGVHPNNEGGAIWAEKFWSFYEETRARTANTAP
jgi:hypothetical protein